MTYENAVKEMKALADGNDEEADHVRADQILCEYLASLGATELVDAWRKIDKWYA